MEDVKIIPMPQPNALSDDDIYNLVMGVIKMVARHATEAQIQRLMERLCEL